MYVCGQKELKQRIESLIERDKFPRFCIFTSPEGFGKKVMSEWTSKKLGCTFVPCGTSIDDVRDTISKAYNTVAKTLFMIFDADDMSVGAKNALLKVTEEPPNDAYFIMTVQNLSNVLPTIISRATVFHLNNYSVIDLKEYAKTMDLSLRDKTEKIAYQISTCPKDITICNSIDVIGLYDLADKFVQNIGFAKIYNEFKISSSLNVKKDEDDKFDPVLFMRCVMLVCESSMKEKCSREDYEAFAKIIKQTSKHLSELCQKGSNKQMILDNWILNTHLDVSGGAI